MGFSEVYSITLPWQAVLGLGFVVRVQEAASKHRVARIKVWDVMVV
jgi:hypothetical protein